MTANEVIHYMRYGVLMNTLDIPVKVNGKEITDIKLVGSNKDGNFYFNLETD